MTVKDLKRACSDDDCVCVCDIATDTCLYDSYLCDNSTHDNIDDDVLDLFDSSTCDNIYDDVLDMTVSDIGTGDQFGLIVDVDTCIV